MTTINVLVAELAAIEAKLAECLVANDGYSIKLHEALVARERAEAERDEVVLRMAGVLEMLKELADELGEWVEHHYKETKDHGLRRQYERDMDPVHRARVLLVKGQIVLDTLQLS